MLKLIVMQTVTYLQLFLAQKYTMYITGNKYKFVQIVQETAADDHVLTFAVDKISTCYSRWCLIKAEGKSAQTDTHSPKKCVKCLTVSQLLCCTYLHNYTCRYIELYEDECWRAYNCLVPSECSLSGHPTATVCCHSTDLGGLGATYTASKSFCFRKDF